MEEPSSLKPLEGRFLRDEPRRTPIMTYSSDPCHWLCDCLKLPKLGHNYILCYFRNEAVMLGPHWLGVIVITTIIIGGTICLNISSPWGKSDPFYHISIVLGIFCFGTLWLMALSDPGIVTNDAEDKTRARMCAVCDLMVPNTSYHCRDCAVCIEEWDHHCVWMGKCVGKKNIVYFKLFNFSWLIFLLFLAVHSILSLLL
mmetsp:Transcript_15400/g.22880  ORF Transcript_15400/g.22880 Transcript_15400/m.22880 type:complete len:200 (-) Transcript_15400:58-657(-)